MYLSCRTRQNSVWSEWLERLLEASLPLSRGISWSGFLTRRLSHWLAGLQSFHAHWFRSWWSGFRNPVFAAGTGHRMAPTASVLRAELGFGPAHCCVYRAKNCAWPTQKCLLNKWRKQQMSIEEEAGALKLPSKVIWNKPRPLHRPSTFNTNRVSQEAKRHWLLEREKGKPRLQIRFHAMFWKSCLRLPSSSSLPLQHKQNYNPAHWLACHYHSLGASALRDFAPGTADCSWMTNPKSGLHRQLDFSTFVQQREGTENERFWK